MTVETLLYVCVIVAAKKSYRMTSWKEGTLPRLSSQQDNYNNNIHYPYIAIAKQTFSHNNVIHYYSYSYTSNCNTVHLFVTITSRCYYLTCTLLLL